MEYSNRRKKTKREKFLDAMEEIIPWSYRVFNEQQVPDATTQT